MAAASTAPKQNLVKYLAVGKLVKDASGNFVAGKHLTLCSLLSDTADPAKDSYKTRVNDIMSKAASKLSMGKRICLTSDDPGTNYELHLLPEEVEGTEGVVIIYFVAVDPGFGKAHSITKLLADFKSGLYEQGGGAIASSGNGELQSRMSGRLQSLSSKFGSSKITTAQNKVEEVKAVMRENVDLALANVDKLQDMEEKSSELERESKSFSRGATKLARSMKCKNIKIVLIFILLVLAVLAAIIFPLVKK